MCINVQPGHQSSPCTLAVPDWRLLWPAQDNGFLMKKRNWKMQVLIKIYFSCASSTSSLAISPLLLIHHLHPSKKVQPKQCPLLRLPSAKDFLKSTEHLAAQGIASQRPQRWTHISNSNTEPWQGKFDKLLSHLSLLHLSSALNCNLSLDLLHPLRAVLMLFPLTCSV